MAELMTIAEHFERTLKQDCKQSLLSSWPYRDPHIYLQRTATIWALHRVETEGFFW